MGFDHSEQSKSLLVDGERRSSQDSYDEIYPPQSMTKRVILKMAASIHPAHATTVMYRLGYSLIPQPVRSFVWEDYAPASKQYAISYLNGLRGLTALKVFTFHYMMAFTDFTFVPFATDERHTNIFALPFIRYFYGGFTSHIFFCVAGYLTSLRLLQLIDRNDTSSQAKVLMTISGSLFRRGFRLYLPVFIITLITATYIYMGFYESNRPHIWNHVDLFPGEWNEEKPAQFSTYLEQLRFWAHEMYQLTNINSEATFYPLHDQHLWSILAEMRASLHLYGCLIALMPCKRHIRLALLLVTAVVYFFWNRWEVWVYILGAAIAQLDLILEAREERMNHLSLEKQEINRTQRSGLRISKELYIATRYTGFMIAFYLLSFPIYADRFYAPGYETLKMFIPEWVDRKDKFYSNIGTALLVLLLVRSSANTSRWRKILMSPVPQYLGTISFGFYLTQGLLLHMYGYMIPQWIWWSFGVQGKDVNAIAWIVPILIGWLLSGVTVLWVADVWTREVEGRCVKLVKWLEKACFKEN